MKMQIPQGHRFCVAPMMEWTDRHCRYFHRLLTRRARLYTEMITSAAIEYGDTARLLAFRKDEHPVALQVGGSDPRSLALAARAGADTGYDEINLNCGCPSDRVQAGRFGACLMAEPDLVAECAIAMRNAAGGAVPITVKCRIGIDDQDSEEALTRFVAVVAQAGVDVFIVHARKAWLTGLSPKQNRDIPSLDYGRVYRLKANMPHLHIVINGGITSLAECAGHLGHADGVMLGRAAYKSCSILREVDAALYGEEAVPLSLIEVLSQMQSYAKEETARGEPLAAITRHMTGLLNGYPGARRYRQILTGDNGAHRGQTERVFEAAMEIVASAEARLSLLTEAA